MDIRGIFPKGQVGRPVFAPCQCIKFTFRKNGSDSFAQIILGVCLAKCRRVCAAIANASVDSEWKSPLFL